LILGFRRLLVTRRHFILFVDSTSLARSGQSIINVSLSAALISASASRRAWSFSTAWVSGDAVVGRLDPQRTS
jgi:hypothetical protein